MAPAHYEAVSERRTVPDTAVLECPVCLRPGCELTHTSCGGEDVDEAVATPGARDKLICDGCGDRDQLLEPAELCGFCIEGREELEHGR